MCDHRSPKARDRWHPYLNLERPKRPGPRAWLVVISERIRLEIVGRIMSMAEQDKKTIERQYLEQAVAICPIFPEGKIISYERPDFLLETLERALGMEVTVLCREEERAQRGNLSKVADKAKTMYHEMPGARALHVSAAFAVRAKEMKFPDLAASLADFVHRNHHNIGSSFKRNLPDGYCHIGIFDPGKGMPSTGRWQIAAGYFVSAANKELLGHRI